MTIGGSLLLVAAGAILKYAVTAHVTWINLHVTGTVLFVVGLIGLGLAVVFSFRSQARGESPERTDLHAARTRSYPR